MTQNDFVFWLQGFVEIQNSDNPPTKEQWQIIKDHLQLVFRKVTPNYVPQKNCSIEEHTYCGQSPFTSLYGVKHNIPEINFNDTPRTC